MQHLVCNHHNNFTNWNWDGPPAPMWFDERNNTLCESARLTKNSVLVNVVIDKGSLLSTSQKNIGRFLFEREWRLSFCLGWVKWWKE